MPVAWAPTRASVFGEAIAYILTFTPKVNRTPSTS